jgi:hypothetical protein
MELYGPSALFGFVAIVYLIFVGIILYRMQVRGSVPAERRGRFIALLRTSTIFAKLTKSNQNGER